jgi:diguanylate cyclase (GGDEF)-like protein
MEKLSEEYRRIERDMRPFSILLMDIDKFKNVNDTYGHPVGDIALKAMARVLKDTGRGSDFVARYGGEEFAIGMVDTNIKGALQTAERVRKLVEKTAVARMSGKDLMVTVSIGVSSFPEDTKNRPTGDLWTSLTRQNGQQSATRADKAPAQPGDIFRRVARPTLPVEGKVRLSADSHHFSPRV